MSEIEVGQAVIDVETGRVGTVIGTIRSLGLVRIKVDTERGDTMVVMVDASELRPWRD
jgi:hypothetical protein